jgi:hypothetical protein
MKLGIGVECALEHAIESLVVGVVMHSWTWTLLFVLMFDVVKSYLFIYCTSVLQKRWASELTMVGKEVEAWGWTIC